MCCWHRHPQDTPCGASAATAHVGTQAHRAAPAALLWLSDTQGPPLQGLKQGLGTEAHSSPIPSRKFPYSVLWTHLVTY